MTDTEHQTVMVPSPDGWLRLPMAVYRAHLVPTAADSPDPLPEPLVDAKTAAVALSVSARWLEDAARMGIVPHYKLGRFVRFKLSEIEARCRAETAGYLGKNPARPADQPSARLRNPLNGRHV